MKKINAACVGGWHDHYQHFSEKLIKISGCTLAGVWDDDLKRGKAWAEAMDCRLFSEYEEILEDKNINSVIISASTADHAKYIIPVANAGKNIYVEQALSTTNEDAYAMQEAVHQAEKKYGIHFAMANPIKRAPMVFAKQLADEGKLGVLTNLRIRTLHDNVLRGTQPPWFYNIDESGGGAMINMGCHGVKILNWFFGKPISACALFSSFTDIAKKNDIDENTISIYKFKNGEIGSVETGWIHPKYHNALDVYGTKGCVCVTGKEVSYRLDDGDWVTVPEEELPEGVLYPLNYWVNSIINDTPNEEYDIDEAVTLTEMITAVYQSKGKEILL